VSSTVPLVTAETRGPNRIERRPRAVPRTRLWHRVSVRLALIIVCSVALTSGLTMYDAFEARRAAIGEIGQDTQRTARLASAANQQLIHATDSILAALAVAPAIQHMDWPACRQLLSKALGLNSVYANFGVAGTDGTVVCSARPLSRPVNIADREYFQLALATQAFSIGGYQIGRVVGTPTQNFALPVVDATGAVHHVIYAAVDLRWLRRLAGTMDLPAGSTINISDARGRALVRYPNVAGLIGRTMPYADVIASVGKDGLAMTQRIGLDGVWRVYGIVRLTAQPQYEDTYLSVGIPVSAVVAPAQRAFLRNLTLVLVLGLLTALVALGGAALQVQRPLDALTRAAKRLAAGDLRARAGSAAPAGELRQVLDTFDEMASALERRTTALHDAQARYRALVEQSLAGVAVLNAEKVLYANDAIAKILGYTPEELVGRPGPHRDLVHPEDRALAAERLRLRFADDHDPIHYTLRFLRKDGSIVYAEVFGRRIAYQGQPAVIVTVLDISARLRAEAALRASEESYRSLVDRVPVGLYRTTADGRFLQVNPAGLEIMGYPDMETAAGLSAGDLYADPEDRRRFRSTMERDNVVDSIEYRLRRPDGSVIWVRDRARAMRDGRGGVLYFEGFMEDVTRQRQAAEEQARRAAEREAFHELSVGLRSARTSRDMYTIVVEHVKAVVGAGFVSLNLLDAERRQFTRAHSSGTLLGGTDPVFPLAGSLSEPVIETGRSRVLDLLTAAVPAWWNRSPLGAFGAVAVVPVRTEDATIGTILAARLRESGAVPFTEVELQQLQGIAEISGIAIRRAELAESLARRVETLTALYGGAERLAGSLDPDRLAVDVVRTCVESFGLRMASLAYLTDEDTPVMAAHYPSDSEGVQTADGRVLDFRQIDPETCRALREAESPVIRQLAGDRDHPAWESAALVAGMRSAAFVPLISRAKPFGFLVLYSDQVEAFTTERVEFLTAYAHQAAAALQNARLFDDAERRLRELGALNDIDRAVRSSLDLRVILQVLLDKAAAELQVDAVDVLLLDPETQTLSCPASRGFRGDAVRRVRQRLGDGYAGQVALSGRPVSLGNLNGAAESVCGRHVTGESFVSYYAVPLVAKGVVKGVLEVYRRSPMAPTQEWHAFFEALAGQAAIAIDNVSLFDDLHRANASLRMSYDDTLAGWSRALDLRDRETEGHSGRVAQLTITLARAMDVPKADLVHIRRGALLHDIGKMGVPDAILLKPGPLTEAEWKTMRHHPAYARQLLEPIAYLRRALDIPYCHHEWWDGTGYPQGLSGSQIPLAARIFAVVDVWDALRSDRPYRPAWSVELVRAYVRDQAGTQFDPAVVRKFLELLDRGALLDPAAPESMAPESTAPGPDQSTRADGAAADEIAGLPARAALERG